MIDIYRVPHGIKYSDTKEPVLTHKAQSPNTTGSFDVTHTD